MSRQRGGARDGAATGRRGDRAGPSTRARRRSFPLLFSCAGGWRREGQGTDLTAVRVQIGRSRCDTPAPLIFWGYIDPFFFCECVCPLQTTGLRSATPSSCLAGPACAPRADRAGAHAKWVRSTPTPRANSLIGRTQTKPKLKPDGPQTTLGEPGTSSTRRASPLETLPPRGLALLSNLFQADTPPPPLRTDPNPATLRSEQRQWGAPPTWC